MRRPSLVFLSADPSRYEPEVDPLVFRTVYGKVNDVNYVIHANLRSLKIIVHAHKLKAYRDYDVS